MTDHERKWNWFARIFEVCYLYKPKAGTYFVDQLFKFWKSGYDCRKVDEEEEKRKAGLSEPG